MQVIYLYGAPAIGKRTVANKLAKITNFKVVDNHIHTPIALRFFTNSSKWYWELRKRIREAIFEIAAEAKIPGLILTGVYESKDIKEIKYLVEYFRRLGAEVFFFHLTCSDEERKQRVVGEDRKDKQLRTVEKLRPNKLFSKIKGIKHTTLDITKMSPESTAKHIRDLMKKQK